MKRGLHRITRRNFLQSVTAVGITAAFGRFAPTYAASAARSLVSPQGGTKYDISVEELAFSINGRRGTAIAMNGTIPGPLLRFREGEETVIRVTNRLRKETSIHWHGILLPANMDGVPGVSFAGIKPGETFTYCFTLRQSGTYWYHSHSAMQEQSGQYGPLLIDPVGPEPFEFDREYVVMLSDWTFEDPEAVAANLKKQAGFYNFQKRTVSEFFSDVAKGGGAAVAGYLEWGRMRMDPTDILDVTGSTYTYLMNGLPSSANWTALFRPGEKVRLRLINGSSGTFFDFRIPGVPMTVVKADGQDIEPVTVEEIRLAVAETYDVIVEPKEERAYTIFAESMDRSGFVCGTLAQRGGMIATIPERRPRPLRTMADMGMIHNGGMNRSGMGEKSHGGMNDMDHGGSENMNGGHGQHDMSGGMHGSMTMASENMMHGPDHHGPGNAMVAMMPRSRLSDLGIGLENASWRVLVYSDLRALKPFYDTREPGREIELHLTGNMERFMWSINGKKYSEHPAPIPFTYGERLRVTFVNDTMMEHPMHLHGMWMVLENGNGHLNPRKHTISVKPAEKLSFLVTADAPGEWAFHCHFLYHMEAGMFRVVSVSATPEGGRQ